VWNVDLFETGGRNRHQVRQDNQIWKGFVIFDQVFAFENALIVGVSELLRTLNIFKRRYE
jgi:hypothetical protein